MAKLGKVRIFSYGWYDGDNYGVHALALRVLGAVIYFSYDTPIAAYFDDEKTLYVDTYPYSRTTNKHRSWARQHAHGTYHVEKEVTGKDITIEELVKEKFGDMAVKIVSEAF